MALREKGVGFGEEELLVVRSPRSGEVTLPPFLFFIFGLFLIDVIPSLISWSIQSIITIKTLSVHNIDCTCIEFIADSLFY